MVSRPRPASRPESGTASPNVNGAPAVHLLQRRDFFITFPGSSPENRNEGISRDYMSEMWQKQLRRLLGPVLAEPWPIVDESWQGAKKQGPVLTKWPSEDHAKYSPKHHLSAWMWDALNQCALHQYNPAASTNYLLSHISTAQTQQQIRKLLASMEAHDTLKKANAFDKLYHAVLVTLPETTPDTMEAQGKLGQLRPTADETIIEYYVRFASVASLVINAVDYGQYNMDLSQTHLQVIFANTLIEAGRDINLGKLANWMNEKPLERKHPRQEAAGYENLWSLVMANERLTDEISKAPQTQPPLPTAVRAMQAVVPYTGANDLGKGREDAPQNNPKSTASDNPNLQTFIQTEVARLVKQALQGQQNKQPAKRVRTSKEQGERTSEQAKDNENRIAKLEQAKDDDLPTWKSLPYPLKGKVVLLGRAILRAKNISQEISTIENSADVKKYMNLATTHISSNPELKAKFPTGFKYCLGCVAYGHSYNTRKCPTA